jgi:hypothetical protein
VTSKPAEVAPHLDVILLALSIFSLPVTSAAAAIVGIMSDELKAKIGGKGDEGKEIRYPGHEVQYSKSGNQVTTVLEF